MNGLLEQPTATTGMPSVPPAGAIPPVAAQTDTQPADPGAAPPRGEVDQEEIDIFVANGIKLIHTAKISDSLIMSIVTSKNPVGAVADATLAIVSKLEASSSASGRELSLGTIAYGSNYIMGEIITSAETAGMKKMTDEEKAQAFSLGVGKYLDNAIKTGKMTKEEVIALGKEAEGSPEGQKIKQMAMQKGGPTDGGIT